MQALVEDVSVTDELDAAGVLEEAARHVYARRAAEVHDLRLVSRWAALHASDPKQDPTASPMDYLVPVGGDGSPWVRDLCLAEIAVARQVHELSVRAVLADVLDLQHRLPRVWALVEQCRAEPWLARKVASMSRRVPLEDVGVVDGAVADAICGEAPSRVLELAAAKVIEADPEGHERRVAEQRRRRFVTLGRTDEHGLRHLVARLAAGDAAYLDATVDRVARILHERHPMRSVDPRLVPGLDELRSEALGLLGRPAEVLTLLLSDATERPDVDTGSLSSSSSTAVPADLLDVLARIDPAKLRPQATVYVHVSDEGLSDPRRAVARAEGLGPVLLSQLDTVLGHAHVTVKPVIDLAEAVRSTAYEHPASVKERVWLLAGRDTFPYSSHTARNVDFDHVEPYRADLGPGQTGTHNSQPLSRRSHRRKTHAGFSTTQLAPGTYLWRTPHGHYLEVGPNGTFPVNPQVLFGLVT